MDCGPVTIFCTGCLEKTPRYPHLHIFNVFNVEKHLFLPFIILIFMIKISTLTVSTVIQVYQESMCKHT